MVEKTRVVESALWLNAEARCLPRDEAERAYWAAHELGSRRGELLEILYLSVVAEDWEAACAHLDRHPEIASALIRAGLDLLRGRDVPQKREVWETASSELVPRSCFWRGVIAESLGEREAAWIDYTTAMRSDEFEVLVARRLARWHGTSTCRLCVRNAADYCFGEDGVWCQECLRELTERNMSRGLRQFCRCILSRLG